MYDIFQDANRYHQACSMTRTPTLWLVIPAMESLSSRWEKKAEDPKYELFHDALRKGLDRLLKYYLRLDDAYAYILALCTYMLSVIPPKPLLTPSQSSTLTSDSSTSRRSGAARKNISGAQEQGAQRPELAEVRAWRGREGGQS